MSRVRFKVLSFFEEFTAFSIRESSDGSLIFLFKPRITSFGDGQRRETKDFHITAHTKRRDQPNINKVKYSLKDVNGVNFDGSLLVTDKKKRGFIFPIVTVFAGDLSFAFRPQSLPSKERGTKSVGLVGIGTFDSVMSYTIYAHDRNIDMPRVQGFSSYTEKFSTMSSTIYGTFITAPASPIYVTSSHFTLPMRKDGKFLGSETGLVRPRMTTDGIERFLQSHHSAISSNYLDMIKRSGRDLVEVQPLLYPWGTPFRWPSRSDEVHEAYGVWARTNNEIYEAPKTVDGIRKPVGYNPLKGRILTRMISDERLNEFGVERRREFINKDA